MSNGYDSENPFELMKWIIVIGIGVVVLVIVAGFIFLSAERPMNDIRTDNIKHSIGYVESHNEKARDAITQYKKDEIDLIKYKDDAEAVTTIRAHMKSLLNDIRRYAGELDPSEVDTDVQQFINEHANDDK